MTETTERQQHELVRQLRELEGQNLGIATLGGWVIGGQMGEMRHCVSVIGSANTTFAPLITIGAVNIFGPALDGGSIALVGTFRVWSNIRALTQVLRP
jgi:hypothetical protein